MQWRVGSKVPLNIYEGDRPVCQCHREIDAARIVDAVNRVEALESENAKLRERAEAMAEALEDHVPLGDRWNHEAADALAAYHRDFPTERLTMDGDVSRG